MIERSRLAAAMTDLVEAVQQGRDIATELLVAARDHNVPLASLTDRAEKTWGSIPEISLRRASETKRSEKFEAVRQRTRAWTEDIWLRSRKKPILIHMSFDAWLKQQAFGDSELDAVAQQEFHRRISVHISPVPTLKGKVG